MEYRYLSQEEAGFLSSIFVTPEYDLYFAENDTTEQEWKERCSLFDVEHSYIISKNNMDIGWIMYTLSNNICSAFTRPPYHVVCYICVAFALSHSISSGLVASAPPVIVIVRYFSYTQDLISYTLPQS